MRLSDAASALLGDDTRSTARYDEQQQDVCECVFIECINKYVNVCLGRRVGAAQGLWLTSGYFCPCEQELTGLACQTPCEH